MAERKRDHLASHLRRLQLEREHARLVAEALLEDPGRVHPRLTRSAPGDLARLRALPVIGRGVGGAQPGTRPDVDGLRQAHRDQERRQEARAAG